MADAPKQLRLTDETFERFKSIASDNGLTAQQTMDSLLLAYETGMSRADNPDVLTDIDNFQLHMNAITESYLHILQLKKDTEDRVRVDFANKLQSKDATIEDLQSQKAELTAISENAKLEINNNQNIIQTLTKENEEKSNEISSLQNQLKDKEDIISGLREKTLEIESLKAEHKKLDAEIEQSKTDIKTKDATIQSLKDDLTAEQMKVKDMTRDAEIQKQKSELDKQLAVSQIKETYSDKVESLRADKEKLLDEISKLKDYIRQLDQPKAEPREDSEDDNPEQLTFD